MEIGLQEVERPVRAAAIGYGLALLRGSVALWCLMASAGNVVAMVYGLSELYAVCMSVVNTGTARRFDSSSCGLLLPLLYCCGMVVFPIRTNPAHWLDLAAVMIGVSRFGVVILFGRCYSNGVASWVELCEAGPYAWIRHPQAALGLLLRLVFIVGNLSWPNVATGIVFLCCVLAGVCLEERFLQSVEEWRSYSRRVPWRLMPGIW